MEKRFDMIKAEILRNIFIRRLQRNWKKYAYRIAPSLEAGNLS
jgi:hypothetical protein